MRVSNLPSALNLSTPSIGGSPVKVRTAFVLLLSALFTFSASAVRADQLTVFFDDVNNMVTVTGTSSLLTVKGVTCGTALSATIADGCSLVITNSDPNFLNGTPHTPTLPNVLIYENGSTTVTSDQLITGDGVFLGEELIGFSSYYAGSTVSCFHTSCTTMTEDGTVQTAGTMAWTDGQSVLFEFQSDLDNPTTPAPEPSSILLLLAGFAIVGLGALRYRFV